MTGLSLGHGGVNLGGILPRTCPAVFEALQPPLVRFAITVPRLYKSTGFQRSSSGVAFIFLFVVRLGGTK